MSSSTPDASTRDASSRNGTRAAVLTVSDSCSRGEKVDLSGPAVAKALERRNISSGGAQRGCRRARRDSRKTD